MLLAVRGTGEGDLRSQILCDRLCAARLHLVEKGLKVKLRVLVPPWGLLVAIIRIVLP